MPGLKRSLIGLAFGLSGLLASQLALAHGPAYGSGYRTAPASPWIGHAGGPPPAWGGIREGHGAWGGAQFQGHGQGYGHGYGHGHGHHHGHGRTVVIEREVYVAPPPPPVYRQPVYVAPQRPAVVISVPPIVFGF